MTTLSVTIEDNSKLQMLIEWLRSITFVKKVEVGESKKGNFEEVSKALEQLPEGGIMKEISDPVEWQKQLRDEW
ncbi:MAG: hypothetical protein IJ057_11795 [Bacteroidales bacterium]|nr:hypothetical protein [Bacteroidales bacterium]